MPRQSNPIRAAVLLLPVAAAAWAIIAAVCYAIIGGAVAVIDIISRSL